MTSSVLTLPSFRMTFTCFFSQSAGSGFDCSAFAKLRLLLVMSSAAREDTETWSLSGAMEETEEEELSERRCFGEAISLVGLVTSPSRMGATKRSR